MSKLSHIFGSIQYPIHGTHLAVASTHHTPFRVFAVHPSYTLLGAIVLAVAVFLSLHQPTPLKTTGSSSIAAAAAGGTAQANVNPKAPSQPSIATDNTISNSTNTDNDLNNNSSSASVVVNGQNIPVPENGTTEQILNSSDGSGQTTVRVSGSHTATGTSFNSSVSSVNKNVSNNASSVNSQTSNSQDSP